MASLCGRVRVHAVGEVIYICTIKRGSWGLFNNGKSAVELKLFVLDRVSSVYTSCNKFMVLYHFSSVLQET